jgi:endonuclease/exonuclease/phosphatase family metal-dependent hydrolase
VLSWNVAKRRDCSAQVSAIARLTPDVVVLQEVNARTWPRHKELLADTGLVYATSAVELASPLDRTRSLSSFVAVASRWPLCASAPAAVPAPEAIACVTVQSPASSIDFIGVHIPTVGRADVALKVETQEGLLRRIADLRAPTLLCGDFNSPKAEGTDGAVTAFARRPRELRAELALIGRQNACGMIDLFRQRHGYGVDGCSWAWRNRGRTGGFRLDHIFADRRLSATECAYIHDWRLRGLSDHSAIYADVIVSNLDLPSSSRAQRH